jgi:hypothetical protein
VYVYLSGTLYKYYKNFHNFLLTCRSLVVYLLTRIKSTVVDRFYAALSKGLKRMVLYLVVLVWKFHFRSLSRHLQVHRIKYEYEDNRLCGTVGCRFCLFVCNPI